MLLIKNGRVHTMCKEGTEKCDILINEGKFRIRNNRCVGP